MQFIDIAYRPRSVWSLALWWERSRELEESNLVRIPSSETALVLLSITNLHWIMCSTSITWKVERMGESVRDFSLDICTIALPVYQPSP